MRPFAIPETKAIDRELAKLIDAALSVFTSVYSGQLGRLLEWITGGGETDLTLFFAADELVVADEIAPWFAETLTDSARAAFASLEATGEFADVTRVIAILTDEMAATFAQHMTANSLVQTQTIVTEWLANGGTRQELIDALTPVWEGPRPEFAANTEPTRVLARGRLEAFRASGVVSGYRVRTQNDDRVRERHADIARGGPYSLNDTEHLPPFGDVNCRCEIVEVIE